MALPSEAGRAAVRQAVAAYFADAALGYVGTVYPARPEILPEEAYEESMFGRAVPSENGSNAVLVVNIASDTRQRQADTGRGAVNDTLICKVAIEVFFASTGGVAVAAQEDYDTVVDEMVALVRANATMSSTKVWSAGEYESGVVHDQGEPFTDADGLVVFILGAVSFDAYQWIAGNV